MNPDLEIVNIRGDHSFKVWSHGYPYRTVRWHFHPEYELHLVTATHGYRYVGDQIGSFRPGDLVLVGPNLPHNWISNIEPGEIVVERCLVLQFTENFIFSCMTNFPELRFIGPLLKDAPRGVQFGAGLAEKVEPLLRALLTSDGARRISLFVDILDLIGHSGEYTLLTGSRFRQNVESARSTSMKMVLEHIGRNFTLDLNEADLATMNRQSVSAFSRSFRRHTGLSFVHYVNSLRVDLACQYLAQDQLSITEICYEVGFNNISNFNRQFLSLKSMSPSKFRGLYRKGVGVADAA